MAQASRAELVVRRVQVALLARGPVAVALDRVGAAGKLTLFPLAALALIPLAWLIGEATEQAANYTGTGIGGFLNASFGNAPELIIALVALSDGLTDVVRASLTGSVVGNLLLVLGFVLLVGERGTIDRTSGFVSLATILFASLLLLVPAVPGFHGNTDRHSLAELSLPIAIALILVRIAVTRRSLQRHRRLSAPVAPPAGAWSLRHALAVLGAATVATAFVTETLVGSLEEFRAAGTPVRVLRCDRDRRFGREHHRARQRRASCRARRAKAGGRDRTGVGGSGRWLPDPRGGDCLLGDRPSGAQPAS